MKLSSRSEYALLALVFLARSKKDAFIKAEAIATAQNIPLKFLEQILLALKRASFLKSAKGREGGYRLGKSPEDITIAEVIRLFDGALAPTESASRYFYGSTPIEKERKLLRLFREIRDLVARKLEATSLADML